MSVSIICVVLIGHDLVGWWLAIYFCCLAPFGVGLAAFSVKTWKKTHIFCTCTTIFGLLFGELMCAIDIWHRESVFVHMAMTGWLLGISFTIALFAIGIHNAIEWVFILFLETFAFGIAMSRNPWNPCSP